MRKFFVILFLILFISCSIKKDYRRSDFIAGCYSGANLILKSIDAKPNNKKVIDYCIDMFDNNNDILKILNNFNNSLPSKDSYSPKIIRDNSIEDSPIDPNGQYL